MPKMYSQDLGHFEHSCAEIFAYIQLDGSSNVVGILPTGPGQNATTNYTRAVGLSNSIGQAGAIITQPHTATGTYIFNLDDFYIALVNSGVQQTDPGAVNTVTAYIDANVTNQTSGIGNLPGNNSALGVGTVRIRFRGTTGTLADPTASTGFWLYLCMRKTGVS